MRAQLLHLSGSRRGRTDTPAGPTIRIGSAVDADVRFPTHSGVAAEHAVIRFDDCGCDFLIEARGGQVFVEHRQVEEAILKSGDLIEFGVGGPKARFRVWQGNGRACKPVRRMVEDAVAVGRSSGVVASGQSLVRDLLTQATLTLKIGFPLLVVALVGLGFGFGWLGGGRSASKRLGPELEALRTELAELRERDLGPVLQAEIDELRVELAERSAEVDELAAVRDVVRDVLLRQSRAACLIHGVWGMKLPEAARSPGADVLTDASGKPLRIDYTGSGFHLGEGRIVTNRHVAVPWDADETFSGLIERGFEPQMLALSATFPGGSPLLVDPASTRLRPGDDIDVAVLRADVPADVPVLEVDARDAEELGGETVLVVGYPTGVNALLAKTDPAVAREVLTASAGDLGRIIDGLAARGAVSPIITRGVLSEVRESRLVYDAETTSGGSGGPVFGSTGKVLGVNFAITRGFDGSNFGVPIRYAVELLDR